MPSSPAARLHRRQPWCERLVGDGRRVRALARSRTSAEAVERLGAEPVRGDLGDHAVDRRRRRRLRRRLPPRRPPRPMGPARGLRRRQRHRHGERARRLPRGRREPLRPLRHRGGADRRRAVRRVDETAPLRPDSKALYSATKALAEQAVRAANADGFETVVVRPRFVWGKGDTTLLPAIVDAVKGGALRVDRRRRHLTSTTHVDNVVEGLVLAAERGRGRGGLLRHRRRAGRVPRVRLRAARDPGRRTAARARSRPRWPRAVAAGSRGGLAAAAPRRRAAADQARASGSPRRSARS